MREINKKITFWSFHSTYWFIYYLFESEFIYGTYPGNHWVVIGYCFLVAAYGAILSLILKYIYGSKYFKRLSKYYFFIVVIISSIIVSHLWLPEIYLLDLIIKKYFGWPTAVYYLREIITMSIVLSIWSVLYLLLNSWYELSLEQENVEKAKLLAKTSQLNSLRYQLNPHFLFNALNSVRALIYKSPETADEMISKLSDFMRYSLSHKDELEVPLEAEIDVINDYLNIEKTRFGNKLNTQINIDPIAYEFPIPPFLMIPIVENAVKYGMKTSKMPLSINISTEVKGNELHIKITNTGNWIEDKKENNDRKDSTFTGLENITRRLETVYPGKHSFNIIKRNESVSIEIKINREISNEPES